MPTREQLRQHQTPAQRKVRKADQLKRLKKKGWKPPKGKADVAD